MGLADLAGKAKDLLTGHGEQVKDGLDKGAELAKDKVEGHDEQIDQAVDKAKDFLDDSK